MRLIVNLDQVYRHRDMAQQTMTQHQAVATDTIPIHTTQPEHLDMETILKHLLIHQGRPIYGNHEIV